MRCGELLCRYSTERFEESMAYFSLKIISMVKNYVYARDTKHSSSLTLQCKTKY